MPTYIKSGTWKQVKEIYVRVGTAWKTVNSAWVRVGNLWKQVHSAVETPYPSGDIKILNYLDNVIDNDTYITNVGDTIYGNRGPTWINSPTAFQYRWRYATESGGTYVDFSPAETSTSHPSPLNTASPLSRINAWNDRWIVYQVRAQNSLGWSEWFTSINEAHLVKYVPVNLTKSITGTPGPFSTLTAVNTWQTTFINTGDWTPASYEYNWYDNTTNELLYTDTVNTYTPGIEDLNRYVRVEITATNTGGSTTAVSAAVGPIEFVLAVDVPTVNGVNNTSVLDNRGGIMNTSNFKISTLIYGVTAYNTYRVRYRYKNVQTGVYWKNGATSTATASWVTFTANASGVGSISSVDVDDVNRITTLYDVHFINETYYDGSTYTAGAVTNGAVFQLEIEISVLRPDGTGVTRTNIYGISAAPVPTITATPSTVAVNSDVVFSGTIGGLGGKPAYPTEYFIDYGDGFLDTNLFSAGARNPTYSITHQYESAGTYVAEISTNPEYTTATATVTAVLVPGAFNVLSVIKGISNGSTRPVTVTWEQSTNATAYEVQLQRQYSDLSGWVTIQSFAGSPYTFEPTRTVVINASPVARYYRATVRATRSSNVNTAAYSNGGTLASPVYVDAVGIGASAPTSLSASNIATTSATISFTAPTSFGSGALTTYQWSLDNITWVSAFSNTSPVYPYGLTAGTLTTVYVRAMNDDGAGGTPGSVTFTTANPPGTFNITSAVKALYDSNLARSNGAAGNNYPGNGARAITINWSQSVNATQYEVQVEGRDYHPIVYPGASQTWIMLRELDLAPYVNEPTRTETFNAMYYYQYRVTARARVSGNLASAAYSGGGSAGSFVYFDVTGTAPGKPTIGTITPLTTSASVPYTNSASTGSASFALSQWSLDQATWTTVSTSPFTIPNLSSSTFYTVYMRSYNYDGISSATPHSFKSFTTPSPKPPNVPTSPTTSGITTTNITFSWTAPGTDATHNAATGYEYYTSATNTAPTGSGTPTVSTSVDFTYTSSVSPTPKYFWVRASNADGYSAWTNSVTATPTAQPVAPTNNVLPGISTNTGNYSVGSIITGTTGTWTGAASYLIQIVRSINTPITSDSALVSNVYTISNTDPVHPSFYFATKVTAYSGAGQTGLTTVAYSATSPISTITPTVGTPTLGTATQTGFTVTWTSGPTGYHTSNVQIYNSSQTLLTTISSQTSPYVWTGGSANTTYYVKVQVIAGDTSASTVTSGFSTSITTLPNVPVNITAPTITPSTGQAGVTTYSVNSVGSWTNSPTSYAYQWKSFDQGSNYITISGATSSSYMPPSNFLATALSPIKCTVTAINAGGSSTPINSSNSAAVTVVTPTGTVSVSGSLTLNSVLTCSVANITNGVSYTYQWYWGLNGVAGTLYSGKTSSTLTIAAADIPNNYFKCIVVATSSTGTTATFTSNIIGPTYKEPAQVTGVTATVTSLNKPYNNGEIGVSWTAPADNSSAITGYLVEYSSNAGSSWTILSPNPYTGGTSFGSSPWGIATYVFRISAINAAGTGLASANSNNAVVTTVPQAPTIGAATAGAGSMSVAFTAGATGGSAITGYTVTSSSGNTGTGTSSPISVSDTGGIARTYTVTATNANGTSAASSSVSGTPNAAVSAPANTLQPTLTGNLSVGSTLTFGVGSWSGSPTSYDLRLYRGTQFVATSETLAKNAGNVTSSTYVITQADFNSTEKYFRAFASATNAGGTSNSGALTAGQELGPITAAASAPSGGTATSTPSTGTAGTTTYVGSTSGWAGSPTSYTYSWQYFSSSSFVWVQVATGTSFSPASNVNTLYPNYGWQLSVGATNSVGTTYATTSITVNTPSAVAAPGVPGSVTLSGSGAVGWSAPTSGGAVASYEIEFYTARSSSGTSAAGPYSVTSILSTATSYQLGSAGSTQYLSPDNYARVRVRATNSGGNSSYSSWIPSATTYT